MIEGLTLTDLKDHPLLSAKDERALIGRAQAGDRAARDELVRCNMRLVIMIASKFKVRGDLEFDDLVQEGVTGLLVAIDRSDLDLGNRLSTYAVSWIRQRIGRAIANTGRVVRLPIHTHGQVSALRKLEENGPLSDEEAAERLDLSVEQVENLRAAERGIPASLDKPISLDDGETTLADYVADESPKPETAALGRDLREKLLDALSALTPREQKMAIMRYGLEDDTPRTLEGLAPEFKVTRERIRQLEAKAFRKLRARHPELRELLASS